MHPSANMIMTPPRIANSGTPDIIIIAPAKLRKLNNGGKMQAMRSKYHLDTKQEINVKNAIKDLK